MAPKLLDAAASLALLWALPALAQGDSAPTAPDTRPVVIGNGSDGGATPVVLTETQSHDKTTGNPEDKADPASFTITYTADVWNNASGGMARGTRYLDNLDLLLNVDLERLLGANGMTLFVYGLYNNGVNFTGSLAGDAQGISNIETGVEAFRLFEAWVQKDFTGLGSIRAGIYNLNSEFDVLDSATLFIASEHGIGTEIAQTGLNGPSIFPNSGLAVRAEAKFGEHVVLRAAVLDGVPGDPDHPGRTVIKLGNGDGALLIGELAYQSDSAKVLLGGWHYTGRFDDLLASAQAGSSVTGKSNSGIYLRGETRLWQDAGNDKRSLHAFARLGFANGRYNLFSSFISSGLTFDGPFASRPDDRLGFAIAHARSGDKARQAASLLGADLERAETAFELTYRAQITSWLALQPDVQYIVNPGLDPALKDVFAVGLRAQLTYTF